ncbi:unnamed protein product [Triticum turgidum subsp. durum]|uniref:Uncharacterized protein n=1 Tax=Triticum turgidum subsp. durum TaxID=4567 RepID=A0A9R1A1Z9_TRITD|nr:unnamed protein product [Triticum turgidum subsp. durum]
MDHTGEHLDPAASASASAPASVAEVNAWLASLAAEGGGVGGRGDLWLRRAEVEEKRDKVHKESKALLDYTRKAITKLTELKRMLEKFKNDVEKQQVEQTADWQTKLVMMDSKERQYILQVSNYKKQRSATKHGYGRSCCIGVLVRGDTGVRTDTPGYARPSTVWTQWDSGSSLQQPSRYLALLPTATTLKQATTADAARKKIQAER